MFLEDPLKQIGLSEKEAKIYLAALELGEDSVQNIAKKAGIKRPTAYLIIEDLKQKGLIFEKPNSRGHIYIAENPDKLKSILEERKRTLGEALPFLRTIYNVEKGKPQVRVYEGLEAMKQIYIDEVWKSKTEILYFASIKAIEKSIPKHLNFFIEGIEENHFQGKIKEFINPDPIDIEYGKKAIENNPNCQIGLIPKDFPFRFSESDVAIFENKIMIASFDQKLFITIIESKVIVDNMRALYEMAWSQATPLKKYLENKE